MIEKIKTEIKRRISVLDRRIENNLYKIDTTGVEEKDAEYRQHAQDAKLTKIWQRKPMTSVVG